MRWTGPGMLAGGEILYSNASRLAGDKLTMRQTRVEVEKTGLLDLKLNTKATASRGFGSCGPDPGEMIYHPGRSVEELARIGLISRSPLHTGGTTSDSGTFRSVGESECELQ